jgi:hypothetical protein
MKNCLENSRYLHIRIKNEKSLLLGFESNLNPIDASAPLPVRPIFIQYTTATQH